jgi:signal transduction histidine kinase
MDNSAGRDLFKKLFPASSLVASGLPAFQRQETIFVTLDLSLLSILLVSHALLSTYWGNPSTLLVSVLGIGFSLRSAEFIWVHSLSEMPSQRAIIRLTWLSIYLDFALGVILSILTNSEDPPYYILLVVPVLLAAFRFPALKLASIILLASFGVFFPVWVFFRQHPPVEILEYLEAGVSSVLLFIVGSVVWMLVRDLRQREEEAEHHLVTLYQTRQKSLEEEKLVALGHLSAAIAGEILTPAAYIWESIAEARQTPAIEGDPKLQAAQTEASRLVSLASDFLFYARLDASTGTVTLVPLVAADVVDSCRGRAEERGVKVVLDQGGELFIDANPILVRQAIMKLVQNAIEACEKGDVVEVRLYGRDQSVCLEVQNPGAPIADSNRTRIFEPFFTTKAGGTGMGLSISRKIARIHGGDLELISNDPGKICFLFTIPALEAPRGAASKRVAFGVSS